MRFLLVFLFSVLFACDTTSINSAYKDYYEYQRIYISAILDNNKNKEISALKNLIKCGKYLNFNVKEYENKLKRLTQKSKVLTKTEKEHVTPNNKPQKKYIKIISSNPFIITLPSNNLKHFILRKKIHVFDIPYTIIPKMYSKKINNIQIKVAQFNKKIVRVAIYSPKINYKIENKKLIIYLNKKITQKQTLIIPKTYKQRVIVIDPGHGGKDSGGIGIGHRMEKIAVLKIAKYLYSELKEMGYKVYLTRHGDYFIPLRERTHFANQKKADLFISIHCNIAPHHYTKVRGIETYFLSPTRNDRAIRVAKIENKEVKGLNYVDQRVILGFLNRDRIIDSQKLAIDIQAGMLYSLKKKYKQVIDGGVRPAPFWVLVGTQMPAILIETGYLTNPVEAKRLFNPAYQKLLAKGIAAGIYNYFKKNP
ncbi:N-acetylmuramoyl-L-alanine amidase [Lebetimonas natsushimae]|uniref:N-acetylmuramoyl-L-alanine amidase n=1 Tax=Lebetimonas natsushimae TaxID=1936991 RepID=A0A292YCT2_9BACT|nr:N-acetylmuramoyl-L-alanine amidase [Lebetimonas natsushimae]GAX87243.1 N-acetylmuramoyl-L-alanine amidase [Lebetimonas natsushimae]